MSSGKRGFASMDRETQRAIARKGGRAVQEKGTGHRFTSEEARAASYRRKMFKNRNASEVQPSTPAGE
jgi:general stress protein YciG